MTTRRLASILAADVMAYSKLVGEDEAGTSADGGLRRSRCAHLRVAGSC
jgi:hypothetical protein